LNSEKSFLKLKKPKINLKIIKKLQFFFDYIIFKYILKKIWKLVFFKYGNKCLKIWKDIFKNYIISKFITFENRIVSIFEKN